MRGLFVWGVGNRAAVEGVFIKAGSVELGRDTGEWAQLVFLIPLLPTPAALCDFLETSPARQYATVVAKFPPGTQPPCPAVLLFHPAPRGV